MSFIHTTKAWAHQLPSTEKLVLLCLAHFANSKTGKCWPSNKQVGQLTGLNPQTVSRAISKLSRRGLITSRRRHNKSSVISVTEM
jgi:DNA-binding MarR family transcriptional regulator